MSETPVFLYKKKQEQKANYVLEKIYAKEWVEHKKDEIMEEV